MRSILIYFAGALLAASYLFAASSGAPDWLVPAWKASGIVLFGVFALANRARLAAAGLFASAAGDVALALSPPQWTAGMAAFGIAHLFYAAAFVNRLSTDGRARFGGPLAVAWVIVAAALYVWFRPDMGELLAPGTGYHAIISVMMALALFSAAPPLARLGAVVFVMSDAVIALGLYKGLGPFGPTVWILYAAAQGMIALGFAARRG